MIIISIMERRKRSSVSNVFIAHDKPMHFQKWMDGGRKSVKPSGREREKGKPRGDQSCSAVKAVMCV